MRITLSQVRQSRLPEAVGKCQADIPGVASFVNLAQERLIKAGGETGWWGGWRKVVFSVSRCNPYVTMPYQFARVIELAYCRHPVRMQNEFYEILPEGIGLQDFCKIPGAPNWCGEAQGYDRGTFPTNTDLSPSNQYLVAYPTDARDVGKNLCISNCLDQNGNPIYSTVGNAQVNGFFMTLAQPNVIGTVNGQPTIVTSIGGIQKDITFGDVLLYQQDATTGAQVLLSRYGAYETNPAYRRYYLNNVPCTCGVVTPASPCIVPPGSTGLIPVTALVKLEFVPVMNDTDFLVIGNIPALIEECKAIRYADMDVPNAAALEAKSHAKAIKLLNDELTHYLGKNWPAINVAPYGRRGDLRRVMCAVAQG